MKTRIHPALGIGVAVVVVALLGWFLYKANFRQETDDSASLTPELRAKIIGDHGGAAQPSRMSRGPATPAQGNR